MTLRLPDGWPPPDAAGRRVVILAGGEAEPARFVRATIADDDLVIAANGGSRLALAAGIPPHLLVGDADSITAAEVASLPSSMVRWQHPPAKDWSDLELALHAAFAVAPRDVVVLGALGGRLDHLLVNVGLLHLACAHRTPMRLLSERGEAFLLEGAIELGWPAGRLVTLVALTPEVHGVTLEGFEYPLRGASMQWGSSRGLSNRVTSVPSRVALESGRLLVVGTPSSVRPATEVRRTYLELPCADAFRPAPTPQAEVTLSHVTACPPGFYRFLYGEAGRDYHWVDRLGWDDDRVAAHLARPQVDVWVMYEHGAPAGWFELEQDGAAVQIAYFGLLPGFLGRGLGGHLLNLAVRQAFAQGAARVWLHTCSLDAPAALPNYLRRGFSPFREETYTVELDADG